MAAHRPYAGDTTTIPMLPADVLSWISAASDRITVQVSNEKLSIGYDVLRAHLYDDVGLAQLQLTGHNALVFSSSTTQGQSPTPAPRRPDRGSRPDRGWTRPTEVNSRPGPTGEGLADPPTPVCGSSHAPAVPARR